MDGKEFMENEDESLKKQWMTMRIKFDQGQQRIDAL